MNWNVCARDKTLGLSSEYQEGKRGYNTGCRQNEHAYSPSGVPGFCKPEAEAPCINGYQCRGCHQYQDCARSHFIPPCTSDMSSRPKDAVTQKAGLSCVTPLSPSHWRLHQETCPSTFDPPIPAMS